MTFCGFNFSVQVPFYACKLDAHDLGILDYLGFRAAMSEELEESEGEKIHKEESVAKEEILSVPLTHDVKRTL